MNVLERLLRVGATDDLDLTEVRRIRLCNMCALIGGFTNLVVTLGFFSAGLSAYKAIAIPNLVNGTLMLSSIAWNGRRKYGFARVWLMTLVHVQILMVVFLVGRHAGFQSYFFVFPPVTLLLLPRPSERIARWTLCVSSGILYLLAEHHPAWDNPRAGLPENVFAPLSAIVATFTFATLILIVYFFYIDTLRAEADLAREHERSEGLLRNILPASIATRLKSEKASIADGFAEVSVLFADLVGFTELSGRLPPGQLVELLNLLLYRCTAPDALPLKEIALRVQTARARRKIAVVAAGRHILRIAFYVLRDGTVYDPARLRRGKPQEVQAAA